MRAQGVFVVFEPSFAHLAATLTSILAEKMSTGVMDL